MVPFGRELVTLIQRVERVEGGRTQVRYRKLRLSGCSWRRDESLGRDGAALARGEHITCRIPADQTVPQPGDCLFRGEVREVIDGSAALGEALEAHRAAGAFRVESVVDNAAAGAPLPHWVALGEGA